MQIEIQNQNQIFGPLGENGGIPIPVDFIITDGGDPVTTDAGDPLITG